MKRFGLILILSLLTYQACHSQSLPTKKEQYDFLRWYLQEGKIQKLSDTTIPFSNSALEMRDIDRILHENHKMTKIEIAFINHQIILTGKPTILDSLILKHVDWNTIKNTQMLSKPPIMLDSLHVKDIDVKTGTKSQVSYSYISLPIFSRDKKTVFIASGYYCGMTCGRETIDVFFKTKHGRWKKSELYEFPVIVS